MIVRECEECIVEILRREVVPALGCTEPAAVALAAANARRAAGGEPEEIKVLVSSNIYKNGIAVGIPGIDRVGIDVAAALGATDGQADRGLEVLESVEKEGADAALRLVDSGLVHIEVLDRPGVYVECSVKTDAGTGRCIIEDGHTNIVLLEANGKTVLKKDSSRANSGSQLREWLQGMKVSQLIDIIREIPFEEIAFMLAGRDMNLEVALKGLEEKTGMGVGFSIYNSIKRGVLSDDLHNYAAALTAAGADVRMAGVKMAVMSSAGSGNHGITAILPVVAVAERIEATDEELARALAISHIITIYIKSYTGKLSALCGCAVAAAIGASSGIAFLYGANNRQIEGTIKNMVANLTGMICDGGKVGCALKLSTAASAALQSAVLAIGGTVVPCDNGIIHCSVEKTIQNLGRVSDPGMLETDHTILEVMVDNLATNKRNCMGC
ncbi:MAG TPA: L-serine ammonia-lyase, iron-sulfur-dependent, subunit alpha [Clostridia bacterium]|nr:L-serine ammonia-lyase, iron-sulfur-dependent, subunit alpha [Clostridia bacterium]